VKYNHQGQAHQHSSYSHGGDSFPETLAFKPIGDETRNDVADGLHLQLVNREIAHYEEPGAPAQDKPDQNAQNHSAFAKQQGKIADQTDNPLGN
jgi:hypothetical protein